MTLSQYCMALGCSATLLPAARHPLAAPQHRAGARPRPPLRAPARPPLRGPQAPGGGHPSVGEGRRFCPVVAAMVAPSCLPGGARGRKEGPPPSLPSTDQSPPSLELLQPVPSASSERFWRRGGPPLGGVGGGWWVPPSPPLAAHTLYIAPPPRHAPASPPPSLCLAFLNGIFIVGEFCTDN